MLAAEPICGLRSILRSFHSPAHPPFGRLRIRRRLFSVQRKLGGRELSAVKGILFHQCDLYDLISVHTEDSEGNGVSDLKAGFDVL